MAISEAEEAYICLLADYNKLKKAYNELAIKAKSIKEEAKKMEKDYILLSKAYTDLLPTVKEYFNGKEAALNGCVKGDYCTKCSGSVTFESKYGKTVYCKRFCEKEIK